MKYIILVALIYHVATAKAQTIAEATIRSGTTGLSLSGASIKSKKTNLVLQSDNEGHFHIPKSVESDTLTISFLGYRPVEIYPPYSSVMDITLWPVNEDLEEVVVSNGYYQVPKERQTGSFTHISNELLNRSIGTNIITRLEGITNGMSFDRRTANVPGAEPTVRIRGISTIYGDKERPLIVVDNFPYDGDLGNINPNDVLDITILRDAAAASIWGARAGNGVVVITTKKGKINEPSVISVTSNMTVSTKPDLYRNPSFLSAEKFIEFEQRLFDRGFFEADEANKNQPILSPAVEYMILQRDGIISEAEMHQRLANLKQYDVRRDAFRYLYRLPIKQQYAVNAKGGTNTLGYFLSIGADRNRSEVKNNANTRFSLTSVTTISPSPKWKIDVGMYYVKSKRANNGINFFALKPASKNLYPYARLVDESGVPIPMTFNYRSNYVDEAQQNGLLNWQYVPLDELALNDDASRGSEIRINSALTYQPVPQLNISLRYQYQYSGGERELLRSPDSYYVRNLVNRFTQEDGQRIFPHGGVLYRSNNVQLAQSGRFQVSYAKTFDEWHNISAIAGAEIREAQQSQYTSQLMGYNETVLTYQSMFDFTRNYSTRPQSSSRLPLPTSDLQDFLDRYVSYYGNMAYSFKDRYIASGSARWDASNLFGVKTNQKGVPLWSIGSSWLVSNEPFYGLVDYMPRLKVSLTWGFSGNIDKSATAYPTISYFNSTLTDLSGATIRSPGNPQLRWEKVRTFNAGVDFSLKNNWLVGGVQYYAKKSNDLMGPIPLDPTTGFLSNYNVNYANLLTKGVDVELITTMRQGKFNWRTNLLLNYVRDKVTNYRYEGQMSSFLADQSQPQVGKSLYSLYSLPWYGLEHETGDPLVMVGGATSKDYTTYLNQLDPAKDLITAGTKIPPFFGSLRSTFGWKQLEIGALIVWRAGHVFRRSGLSYYQLATSWAMHSEYADRWKSPGDELHTYVASVPDQMNQHRDNVYLNSTKTIERGDVIRLQDVNLSYRVVIKSWPLEDFRISAYVRDLGIIWRANKKGIDPDYPLASYPPITSYSIGIHLSL